MLVTWQGIVAILVGFTALFAEMWFLEHSQRKLQGRRYSKPLMAFAGHLALVVPGMSFSLIATTAGSASISAHQVIALGYIIACMHALAIVSGNLLAMPGLRRDYEKLDKAMRAGIRSVFIAAVPVIIWHFTMSG